MPSHWQTINVQAIYKKGPMDECGNFRPISLLCVAYKLLATLMLHRLRAEGAEDQLLESQFGFRRARGNANAVFAARRYIEMALAHKKGKGLMLPFDWAKAPDSINPAALISALDRFGIGCKAATFITSLYRLRKFVVVDGSNTLSAKNLDSASRKDVPYLLSPSFSL